MQSAVTEDGGGLRYAARLTLLVGLAGTAAITWSQSPLAYDGAAILLRTVHHRSPFITHDRWVTGVVKLPAALAVSLTNSMSVARIAFSLAYALLPVVAALIAWLVVRRNAPHLWVWAAIGIFVVTMPGNVFAVSEGETVVQFAWPLLLLTVLGLRRRSQQIAAATLVAVIVTMHPFAVPLLAMVTGLAWLGALTGRVARGPAVVGGALTLVAAGVRFTTFDPYERTQTTAATLTSGFHRAVAGAPLAALLLALAAGIAIVALRRCQQLPRFAPLLVVGPLVGAVAVLAWWASDVTRWQNASAYRGWVLLASVPFFALAVIDAWLPAPGDRTPGTVPLFRSLGAASVACALVFAVTSTLQGAGWHGLTRDFERKVVSARTVCITRAAVLPKPRGPLAHWASNSLAIVLQSRNPKHIVLDDRNACAAFDHGAVPAVVGHQRILKPAKGWVHLPRPH